MATFIGVLLDVSGSMKESFGERPNEENGSWARSIFKVVEGLIKHDVSSSNHVFALGFGASKEPQAFDLLGTVAANTKPLPLPYRNKTKAEVVKELVDIVKENFDSQGSVDLSWAHVNFLMEVLTKPDACLFVEEFEQNSDFRRIIFKFSSVPPFQLGNPFPHYQSQGISRTPHSPLEKAKEVVRLAKRSLTEKILEEILTILEENGAPRVRKWAKMKVLLDAIERSLACSFLEELQRNINFRERFVLECLPETCRELAHNVTSYGKEAIYSASYYVDKICNTNAQEYATRDSVNEVVAKGKLLLSEHLDLVPIKEKAIMDVHQASEILNGGIGEGELTNERVDELMDTVEPLIYGGTPLIRTIYEAKNLFSTPRFKDHSKMMFIISDGQPGDGNNPPIEELAQLRVTTVCCYITKDEIDNPKRLYSTECETWDDAAKLMFAMSSTITTQMIPRTIFVKRGWSIDITNNETRLFVQVNHPDIIEDVCDLARDVVCCQDALSDLLATVSLDLYINQANQGFHPKQQKGGTCYANASAAVLHLSMKRIVGREGGYPDFFELRKRMIQKYGKDGEDTLRVLEEICPVYRLHCKKVDTLGALTAITAKRPVLARFWLTDPEWDTFWGFYEQNPQGVLTSAILDVKRGPPRENTTGHAVVLTSFNSECLRLMNSWGSNWADGGFFKVGNADVLGLEFVDVFWTLKDLKQSEIDAYDRHGPSIAQEMISKLQGLQKVEYRCPRCHKSSNVNEFLGNHLEADCPKCYQKFKIKEAGDDLALNMYLLSLSTRGNQCQHHMETWTYN